MSIEHENQDISADFSLNGIETKKTAYRIKSRAGNTSEIPNRLPVITNSKYQNALTFNKNNTAYLQVLSCTDNPKYRDCIQRHKGFRIADVNLNSLCINNGYEKINLTLLRAFYGILLKAFYDPHENNQITDGTVTIYYPDFARKIGKASNIGNNDVINFIKSIKNFQTVVGVIKHDTGNCDVLPLILNPEYDAEKNTISFISPYITRIIRNIHEASIKRDKAGNPLLKKNGTPQMLPAYSYLIDMKITKEKNRMAVEIVLIVVALIEQAGNNIPHIMAKTIVERNQQLYRSLNNKSASNKNSLLGKTFSKAWELLRTKTYLAIMYKNIKLPDPDDIAFIPTSSTLDMVFTFPHKGKTKNSQTPSDFGEV